MTTAMTVQVGEITAEEIDRLRTWMTNDDVPPSMDGLMMRALVLARVDRQRVRARWLHENLDTYLQAHLPSQRPIQWSAP